MRWHDLFRDLGWFLFGCGYIRLDWREMAIGFALVVFAMTARNLRDA